MLTNFIFVMGAPYLPWYVAYS